MSGMVTLFLGGDVMTGRGIDQILVHPAGPLLHEPYVQDARRYVELAEQAHGNIAAPVDDAYIWGLAIGGGVVTATALADALRAEMDVVLARKLRHPRQPGLAVGSVTQEGRPGTFE